MIGWRIFGANERGRPGARRRPASFMAELELFTVPNWNRLKDLLREKDGLQAPPGGMVARRAIHGSEGALGMLPRKLRTLRRRMTHASQARGTPQPSMPKPSGQLEYSGPLTEGE